MEIWQSKTKLNVIQFTGNNIDEVKDFTVNPIIQTENLIGEKVTLIKDGVGDRDNYITLKVGDYLYRLAGSHRDSYLSITDKGTFELLYKKVENK